MAVYTILPRNCLCNRAQTLRKMKLTASLCYALSTETYRVLHDRQRQCFTVRLQGGGTVDNAVLKYTQGNDKHVHLLSTDVPEAYRGQGVAASLAKAALDFVVEEQLKASISCWYIKKYVNENPHHGYQKYIKDSI